MNDNIILIGFMGSGKTTIGRALSQALDKTFIDMDQEVQKQENRTITEIFQTDGETYFRNLETEFLKSLKEMNNSIISTGGGVIIKDENINILKDLGTVIFLHADVEQIINNVGHDKSRPLLQTDDYKETIRELLESREGKYLSAANIIIQTTGKSIVSIVNEIISLL